MELKEFISESISQILNGIEDAHKKLETNTHRPVIYHIGQSSNVSFNLIEKIEFEVLVHIENNKKSGIGGKINVLSLGIDAGTDKSIKQSHQNRIKFAVPVSFTRSTPASKEDK